MKLLNSYHDSLEVTSFTIMTADTTSPLTKVDSAIDGLISSSPPKEFKHRRTSSSATGVYNINDLRMSSFLIRVHYLTGNYGTFLPGVLTDSLHTEKENIELKLPLESQKTNWYVDHTYLLKTYCSLHDDEPYTLLLHVTMLTTVMKRRKINKSPSTVEDKDILKLMLTTPPVKKIDLHFPLGLEVTARNLKGVTIKDALDAIYKQYRKKVSTSLCFESACPNICTAHLISISLLLSA